MEPIDSGFGIKMQLVDWGFTGCRVDMTALAERQKIQMVAAKLEHHLLLVDTTSFLEPSRRKTVLSHSEKMCIHSTLLVLMGSFIIAFQ
jgi:hypothetical protein